MNATASRAAIYARISRNPSRDELGVRRQEHECRELAASEGLEVVASHLDDDRSAYRAKRRPGWEAVLDLVRNHQVDVVLCWHPDRMTRHPRELEDLVDLLEATRVKVRTVVSGEYDLSTASGRMTARVVGAVARHESEHKSERLKSKASELARAGKNGGGGRPFGFDDDRVTIRPDEADVLRWAVQRILDGASLRRVCREMPLPTVTGTEWSPTVLRRTLTSGRIVGLRDHHGEQVATATWPAIVDRAAWEAVRATLQDPRRKTWRPAQRYLLTGGLAVALDGRPLFARPNGAGKRCYVAERSGDIPGIRIHAPELEALVVEVVLQVTDQSSFAPVAVDPDDDGQIAALEAELDELATLRGRGDVSLREWLAAREPLQARLDAVRKALRTPARPAPSGAALDHPGALREAWPDLSVNDRRDVIAALVEAVVVGPAVAGRNFFDHDRVSIRWRG